MKQFNDMFTCISDGLISIDVALMFVRSRFGIVPGGGWTEDGRIWTRGDAMKHPLHDMEAWDAIPVTSRNANWLYYLELGAIGDEGQTTLCAVDVDNAHDDGMEQLPLEDFWKAFYEFAESLGCTEEDISTLCVKSPHDGIHMLFSSQEAPFFKWATHMHDDSMPREMDVDWLTAGDNRQLTGPGCLRPVGDTKLKYELYAPTGADVSDLMPLVKPLPVPLLRWMVTKAAENQRKHGYKFTTTLRSPLSVKRLEKFDSISDIVKLGCQQDKKTSKKAGGAGTQVHSVACDEVGLWKTQKQVESGSRHNAAIQFAGTCVKRCTGSSFDSTCNLIEEEIRSFAEQKCSPSLPVSEVSGIVKDAMRYAEQARGEIERRIASRVTVAFADGSQQTQVLDDFCQRVVNGASYRCKKRKNGQAGLPISSPVNVVEALEHDSGLAGRFGYDMMNCRNCIVKPLPWSQIDEEFPRFVTDADLGRIITYIDSVASFDPSRHFRVAFNECCARHSFDPLADFVRSFEGRWDGREHMTLLARYMGVDTDDIIDGKSFSQVCLTLMMRGAVRRALHPGCQYDYTLVLCGEQGIGKSSFIRALACRPDWYCEDLSDIGDAKRAFESIAGSWIVNIDELAGFRSAKDVTRIKTFLTARYDDYRAPYKSEKERIPRRQVFMATTNELSFLSDRSGNRRFLLVPCVGVMDKRGLPAFFSDADFEHEIEQAWAQAYAMEQANPNEALALPRWAMDEQNRRNGGASVADPIEETLERIFTECHLTDEPMCYAQVYAMAYDCDESDYLRERHLKSFQDLARRVAKRTGWTEGRFRGTWGESTQKKSQRRGFLPVLSDDENHELQLRRRQAEIDEQELWAHGRSASVIDMYDDVFSPQVSLADLV